MTRLDDLEHEVLNATTSMRLATNRCEQHRCPLGFHNLKVVQDLRHHISRIERAMKVYVASQKTK